HRFADPDETVAVADKRRDMGDLVAAWLPLADGTTELLEGFEEKGLDVVRLQAAGLGALYLLAYAGHTARVHRVVGECALFEQVLKLLAINGVGNGLGEFRPHLGAFAVANGFDQELAQRPALKLEFAEYIEDLATQCLAGLFKLVEQGAVDVAFASLLGYEVPEVA